MKKLIVIAIIALTLVACASQFVTKEYRGKDIPGKSLGVYINGKFLDVETKHLDLIGDDQTYRVFDNFLVEVFNSSSSLLSNFSTVGIADKTDDTMLKYDMYSVNIDENLGFTSLEEGEVFKTETVYYDFVLIIDTIDVVFHESYSNPVYYSPGFGNSPGMWGGGGGSSDALEANYKFVIWDNKEKKKVVYGAQKAKAASDETELNRDTWVQLFNKMLKKLVKNTPFQIEETNLGYY